MHRRGDGALQVRLEADWLVCKIECIPQSGSFELDVPVNRATTSHAAEFTRALAARPREFAGVSAEARVDAGALAFTLQGLPASLRGRSATLVSGDCRRGRQSGAGCAALEWRHTAGPLADLGATQ